MNAPIKCIAENKPTDTKAYKRADKKANLVIGLNALENKIEHASTFSRVASKMDAINTARSNGSRKTATPCPLYKHRTGPLMPRHCAGPFLLMSGVIGLHFSFMAPIYAYANDFDD